MTLPVLNLDLLNSLASWAWYDYADHRDGTAKWDQGAWFQTTDPQQGVCQSSYCIAGQAVTQVGYKMVLSPMGYDYSKPMDPETGEYPVERWQAYNCVAQVFSGLDDKGKPVYSPVGDELPISEAAEAALGLTTNEASALFSGENSIDKVLLLAAIIAGARGLTLRLPADAQEALDAELARRAEVDYYGAGFDVTNHIWYEDEDVERVMSVLYPPPPTCDACGQALPEVTPESPLADWEAELLSDAPF